VKKEKGKQPTSGKREKIGTDFVFQWQGFLISYLILYRTGRCSFFAEVRKRIKGVQ